MSNETHLRCKYCGAKLKYDYLVKKGGMCVYCDNDDCTVKPITEYNYASSNALNEELHSITIDGSDGDELEECD